MEYFSNHSSSNATCSCDTNLYVQITGSILFVMVWPFVVLDMKWFPLGRPAAALVGAAFMVLFQIVSQSDVYAIQGHQDNLQTVFLLVGMMMLSYYYDREGILRVLMLKIFGKNKPFQSIIWKVCLMSAILSAFITNDAACLVVTPLILTEFIKQKRDRWELLPLCLGIATSANIGSAATIFGNPQNAFIASTARVSLLEFFIAELPAAILGLIINVVLIYLFMLIRMKMRKEEGNHLNSEAQSSRIAARSRNTSIASEREATVQSYEDPQVRNESLTLSISGEHEATAMSYDQSGNGATHFNTSAINRSTSMLVQLQQSSGEALPEDVQVNDSVNNDDEDKAPAEKTRFQIIRRKIFLVWLVFVTLLMVVLLAIPNQIADFNLGCIPLAASIFTMLMDTILNQVSKTPAFQNTCFPFMAFEHLAPHMNLNTIEGVLLFSVFVIIGSNIFSNVPLVILIVGRISDLCDDCGPLGGLLLAWISTIAGNFTLIGSVANLIVAEKARSSAEYRISFLGYFIFGFPSTLLILYACLPVVYFMGKLAAKI
uniref:Citrate transporter-like domain-containing protein n=1 Tax=Amphimedon queenslandica TaxID=400682 RepID=A0A1X7UKI2_AMPQE